MKDSNEKLPDPKQLEKEIANFLSQKFGDQVKVVSPVVMTLPDGSKIGAADKPRRRQIHFDLLPEDLVAYLDQYIVKQNKAKQVLATKICTHFNRIKKASQYSDEAGSMVGRIKSNVLMIGPTGVGKTYMVKLIAQKIGVPFVKGDATKFSETGYVGGDVEDLVRDLVREADGDIALAQCGIIYIDEIDKIASSRNIIGADVSRTGVQRCLLKPMEETEVDLKVPHDPISMIQELERFRKSGKRDRETINTRNILFVMSGAFTGLSDIIKKRMNTQRIGFGSRVSPAQTDFDFFRHVKAEDLMEFGFESEFVGRLPVKTVFEELSEDDLFTILRNPNNPIVLGKKLDFGAYGIDIKFEEEALRLLAGRAARENTGARGLVSVVEDALLLFENKLPSTGVKRLAVTVDVIQSPGKMLERMLAQEDGAFFESVFARVAEDEKGVIEDYVHSNRKTLAVRHGINLTVSRIRILVEYYGRHVTDIGSVLEKIKGCFDEIKKIELFFYNEQDINIVIEDDAVDFLISGMLEHGIRLDEVYKKMTSDLELGLKLIREKTGKRRFFITREAFEHPNEFLDRLVREELKPAP